MRTELLKKQVEECYKVLNIESKQVSSNGNSYEKIMNWKDINRALHSLNIYGFMGKSVQNIFDMGDNFIASTETTAVLTQQFPAFINAFNIVKAKCEAIIDMDGFSSNSKNEENFLYVKIPDNTEELEELNFIVKGLNTTFNQCPILRDTYQKVSFEGIDVGSSWIVLSFILTGAPIAAKTLNWVADFIKKCNEIRIQNRTIKKMDLEYIIEKANLEEKEREKLINDISKGIEKENKEKCIESFKSIEIPVGREITPEEESKIVHCMLTLSELLELGVEIYPSINSNEELKSLFPKKEEWKKIENNVKLLDCKDKKQK